MLKPILKMRLKKPSCLGLCPKPRLGGTVKAGAFATSPALEKPTQTVTSNHNSVTYVLSLKCYPCSEPTSLSPFTFHQSLLTAALAAQRSVNANHPGVMLTMQNLVGSRSQRCSKPPGSASKRKRTNNNLILTNWTKCDILSSMRATVDTLSEEAALLDDE